MRAIIAIGKSNHCGDIKMGGSRAHRYRAGLKYPLDIVLAVHPEVSRREDRLLPQFVHYLSFWIMIALQL
jgi:hypothetical protein